MLKKILFLFLFSTLIFTNYFAQEGEKYFISIKLDENKEALNKYELPVYHQNKNVLLTEVDAEKIDELKKSGFELSILDRAENTGKYLIFDKDKKLTDKILNEKNIVRIDDFYLMKKPDAEDISPEFMKVGIKKTPLIYKSGGDKFIPGTSKITSDLIQNVISEVNADSIAYVIQSLQDFGTRHLYNANRKEVSTWIMNQFKKFGIENARLDSFQYAGLWQYNVVAEIPGSSGSEEIIVIGAHHDSITNANPYDGDTAAPGADDNASGTSAVLEIARAIMKTGYQPEKTLVFQTYAAEELGLHGSKDLAQKAHAAGTKIKLMINHDMISNNPRALNDSYVYVNYYYGSNSFKDIAIKNVEDLTPVSPVAGSASSSSDSYSFAQAGYPAVYFAEYDFSPWYHSTDDVITNYDMEYCAEVIKASAATAVTASEYPSALNRFYVYDLGTGNSLLLEWEESLESDIDKYKISVGKSSGDYEDFFQTTDTTFVLNNLNEGEKYYVGISVIDEDGNESPIWEESLIPNSKPLTPKAVSAEADWFKINLAWNPNKEVDLSGYNIYRSENDSLNFEKLNAAPLSVTIFEDDEINSGSYYFYYVSAVDKEGNESAEKSILRSRAVTLNEGIVVIDETENGDGTELKPSDMEVDEYYKKILKGFSYSEIDSDENGGIDLADLGPYQTVLWHGDDNSDFNFSLSAAEDIQKYLEFGGNIIYSGFKPSRAFANNTSAHADFEEGDFIYDYLKIGQSDYNLFSRFNGAVSQDEGYENMFIDSAKTSASLDYHLRGIEVIEPVDEGESIFEFSADYDTSSIYSQNAGRTVAVKYSGENYNSVILTFPLYYMEEKSAKEFLEKILVGFGEVVSVNELERDISPAEYNLAQNYPNPFNPSTTIKFSIPERSFVTLTIYDILGREIATLINERLQAGIYEKSFDAGRISSGVYIYKIQANDFVKSRKMILIK